MKINIFIWFSLGIMKQSGPLHPTLEASAYLCRRKSTFFDVVYKICAAYIIFKLQKTSQVPGEFMTMRLQIFLNECTALAQSTEKKYPTLLQFHNSPTIWRPQQSGVSWPILEWCLPGVTWHIGTPLTPLSNWCCGLIHWTITLWCHHQLDCCNNAPGIPWEIQEVWQQI